MVDTDLKELRRLAEAATRGEWTTYRDEDDHIVAVVNNHENLSRRKIIVRPGVGNSRSEAENDANAAYIAAASPDVILSLLNRIAAPADAGDAIRVKALEWNAWPDDRSTSFEGQNQKRQYLKRALLPWGAVFLMLKDGEYSLKWSTGSIHSDAVYDSEDEAVAAAQSHFEAAIRPAVESSRSALVTDEMVDAYKSAIYSLQGNPLLRENIRIGLEAALTSHAQAGPVDIDKLAAEFRAPVGQTAEPVAGDGFDARANLIETLANPSQPSEAELEAASAAVQRMSDSAEIERLREERDAAQLRLKVYEEADAKLNAEFLAISDKRCENLMEVLRDVTEWLKLILDEGALSETGSPPLIQNSISRAESALAEQKGSADA